MKISTEYPPLYDRLREHFAVNERTVFTYGDTIYVPHGTNGLPAHLLAHEECHSGQQAAIGGPLTWWERYIADPAWRYAQELEAYQVQYRVFCRKERSRNARTLMAQRIAGDLAGPLYGGLGRYEEALAEIRRAA